MCHCGRTFELSLEYDVYSADQLQCKFCKRAVLPDVGERHVFGRVKKDARKAGREFSLPFDWFAKAIHLPCHYCGAVDKNSCNVPSKAKGETLLKGFRYNGLDRINNNLGYVPGNVVPCCVVCNRAKNSMEYTQFVKWIDDLIYYRSNR